MISKVPSRHGELMTQYGKAVVKASDLGEKAALGLNLGSAFIIICYCCFVLLRKWTLMVRDVRSLAQGSTANNYCKARKLLQKRPTQLPPESIRRLYFFRNMSIRAILLIRQYRSS